ncbi:MAG: hypothetical protein ACMG6E_10000 [Candidatus Roizmanbacteria bacterium]
MEQLELVRLLLLELLSEINILVMKGVGELVQLLLIGEGAGLLEVGLPLAAVVLLMAVLGVVRLIMVVIMLGMVLSYIILEVLV